MINLLYFSGTIKTFKMARQVYKKQLTINLTEEQAHQFEAVCNELKANDPIQWTDTNVIRRLISDKFKAINEQNNNVEERVDATA